MLKHHFQRSRPVALIAALAVAAFIVVGCGDSSDDSTSASESTTSSSETTAAAGGGGSGGETVRISETDFKLTPADVSVKPGTVTFEVSNDGETVHNLEIEGPDEEQTLPSDLQPGDSGEVSVDLSQPGTYEMYCPVDGHEDMGMTGEITVEG